MLKTHWVCLRCLSRSSRIYNKPITRSQSTASHVQSGISAVLLGRARSVAEEHGKLSAQNAESFDAKVAKRLGELSPVANALKQWEDAHNAISELQYMLRDPSLDDELRNLAVEDLSTTEASLPTVAQTLKQALIPKHPFAELPCLMEIRPGAGGSEAALFASELLSMYTSYCSRRGWRSNIMKYDAETSVGAENALIEAVVEIEESGAYDVLRSEAGVHRVQRVPATESKGRTHTSAVSVLVLPSMPEAGGGNDSALNYEDPNSDYYVNPQEVRSETMRARGAGGQHVNTTDSAVRLTHIPTGIVVAMQDQRSQHKNRAKAWQVLRAKLAQKRREEREEEMIKLRRGIMGGVARTGRGDKVRTYNFGQSRVTDHRCGSESRDLAGVMEGGTALEKIMADVRVWMVEQEVAILAVEDDAKKTKSKR